MTAKGKSDDGKGTARRQGAGGNARGAARDRRAAERAEDLDTARLVARFQAGDKEAFTPIYLRYFEAVFAYHRVAFRDYDEAEDMTQSVFLKVLEALPAYQRRGQPFKSWLFRIVRNHTITQLQRLYRTEAMDPAEIDRRLEASGAGAEESVTFDWIADGDLMLFIERLPLPQRQVLFLRYMAGLKSAEIAAILDRTPSDVRALQSRAALLLRTRLKPLRKEAAKRRDRAMERTTQQAPVLRQRRFSLL